MTYSSATSIHDDPLAATMLEDPFDAALDYPPYPGLRPFVSAEWPIFFGRETMTDDIIDLVTKKHLVVVHGDSGSGKSSIVRAGVLVQLQQGHAATGARWRTCAMLPREDPLGNLARALAGLLVDEPTPDQILDVRHILNRGRQAPRILARRVRRGKSDHICILVDQFEELFTLAKWRSPEETRLFVDLLVGLQQKPTRGLYAILTMRSEFLGHCARYEGLAEAVNRTQYLLPRMERPALLRAICEPATLYGGEVSQVLAERLIVDAGGGQDQLPLIQHGLMRLWRDKRAPQRGATTPAETWTARPDDETEQHPPRGFAEPVWRLGLEDYQDAGGLTLLLSDHADEVMKKVAPDPERRKIVEHLFRALIDINADGQAIRRPQTLAVVVAVTGSDPPTLKAIIDSFRAKGVFFLTPYGDAPIKPGTLIDVSHEALIRRWWKVADPLEGWLQRELKDGLIWRSLVIQAESFEGNPANVLSPATTDERKSWLEGCNSAWAERYGGGWDRVQKLIHSSEDAGRRAALLNLRRTSDDASAAIAVSERSRMQRTFIIRPFDKKRDGAGKEIDFERIHRELIAPALDAAGLASGTTGQIIDAGYIREDMFGLIIEADLVVCDVTVHNAHVFYQLGIRHALRKKSTVLIRGARVADSIPFDILTDRYLEYSIDEPGSKTGELADVIRAALASPRETDSPIFKMFPTLPEVDPAAVQVVPTDFTEEVARATAAKSPGWLRLLASEVTGLRFQWPALRLIGHAQWTLRDYDGTRRTWERVRANDPDDLAANLALANLYERQYRREKNLDRLEASNQAIATVLASNRATASQRAEALALHGRNLKTLWRLDFEALGSVAERREKANNSDLIKSYEAYLKAYLVDLNHYWSGLAALQMGTAALDLSKDEAWPDAFDDYDQATGYATKLAQQVEALRSSVRLAIDAAVARLAEEGKDRVWVELSRADLLFLTEERDQKVIHAYRAVSEADVFAWNAAKGQLQLFAELGIRSERADNVVQAIDAYVEVSRPGPDLHVIVFAGHRVDEPGRPEPRFPATAEAESRARELILRALRERQVADANLKVLASAAPGSDIICLEVCKELGIESTVCLPMPKDLFASLAFSGLDSWRSRFLKLIGERQPLVLSDQAGLPRWLQAIGSNPWERGNRWMLEMAQTSGARKVSLIALWDGKETGDGSGGTAHMVRIAREAGVVDVVPIDARRILAGFPARAH